MCELIIDPVILVSLDGFIGHGVNICMAFEKGNIAWELISEMAY